MAARRTKSVDVSIIGGGVMGCACAWELSRHGAKVTVLERSVPGAEASSAAAGILGAQIEAHGAGPMAELSLKSRALYPKWTKLLDEATHIDIGYRECGVVRTTFERPALKRIIREVAWQRRAKLKVVELDTKALLRHEPALSPELAGGVHFPNDARIDPPLLLRALHVAAERAGTRFRSGAYVRRILLNDERVKGILLDDGTEIHSQHVVVAAGSWTNMIEGLALPLGSVVPARGQIVELELSSPALTGVVFGPRCYLVPRDDGRVLVGSTLEFVGYQRDVTAKAVRDLLSAAIELMPCLADAKLRGSWSNFRPYTPDELPLLGAAHIPGLTFATGHYRNGILLAPITAEIVRQQIMGGRAPLDLTPFSPLRRRQLTSKH